MRILVTGKTGQLAQSLAERGPDANATVILLGRPEFDLAEPTSPTELLAAHRPDLIVSAAAYTAVDTAESEPERAHAVNAEGPRRLAASAAALGIPVIHISTDYVFEGSNPHPWTEDDPTGPLGVYGASKLAGEQAVLAASPDNIVLRVAWVYSPFGANFAKTILRLARERDELRVVGDQIGTPTSALDIADGVLRVARNIMDQPARREFRGLFHMGSAEATSWAGFARGICQWLQDHSGRSVIVHDITTADYPTKARRPANSRLDSQRLATIHGVTLPSWQSSLPPILERLP